jgi:hypothetical protein
MRVEEGRLVLARAAAQLGSAAALGAQLQVSERVIRHYIEGTEPVPQALLLQVIDLLVTQLPGGNKPPAY